jgi:RND family efflux transporter MFP subunit
VEAGFVRFRPVLMTALAMIIGMLPMALGLGEGGEQNAPLGRAVIGGLIVGIRHAIAPLLMFVPPRGRHSAVIRLGTGGASSDLTLPGNVQAFNSAALYARTNGYVRRWMVDIGDNVRSGQTLAVIDAPEVDQQLAQAQADYQTAAANQNLARTTSVRWDAMLRKDAVSKQEADEKRGQYAANSALANAQAANVKRLRALLGFTRIEAPFGGVVTARTTQIGALVSVGGGQPLFTISDVHRMRTYVRVPQGYSGQIRPGMHAKLTVPEYPGRSFDAVLTRTAGAVDPGSGTVLMELQTDNPDRALKPGGYAQVTFPLKATGAHTIPASALIVRETGTSVAAVDAGNRIRLRPITIARDDGSTIEVGTGLTGNERIVDAPPEAISEGDLVRISSVAAVKQ